MTYAGLWTNAQGSATGGSGARMSPGGTLLGADPAMGAGAGAGAMTPEDASKILQGAQDFVRFGAGSVQALDTQIGQDTSHLSKLQSSGASSATISQAQQQLDLKSQLRALIVHHMQRMQQILAGDTTPATSPVPTPGQPVAPGGFSATPDPSTVARAYGW